MNLNFFKAAAQNVKWALPLLTGLMLFPFGVRGADSLASFTNAPIIGIPPNVDATNFYNSVTWNISTTPLPYQTAHTLNYINDGTMIGSVGWEFDYGPSTGGSPSSRGMSASFYNDGIITANDGEIPNPPAYQLSLGSYLLVSATNIDNVNGTLTAGAGGEIVLNGANVDLSRSMLQITGIVPSGSANGRTTYAPDTAIYDEYWQQTNTFPNSTTPYAFDSSAIWNGFIASSPIFYLNGLCQTTNLAAQLSFFPSLADSTNMESALYMTNIVITNASLQTVTYILPTKIFRQAVFVAVGDPNISPDDRFDANSGNVSNLFRTVTVKLASTSGDTLYLADTLGSFTNRGLLLNANVNTGDNPQTTCTDPMYRPANYVLSRLDPGTFGNGVQGLGAPDTNFFYNPAFSNTVVRAAYAGYGGYVDDLVRDPVGSGLTNLPGRIVINATNLDLTWSTITSAGAEIVIQGNNFIGSTGALVSCRNLSYNLGSDSHNLNVTNLNTTSSVLGFHGNVYAWSGIWTNGLITVFTNYSLLTNTTPSTLTNNVFTNTTEMDFHVLMVDATELSSTEPVTVQDLILQTNAVNMMVSDSMNVVHTLFFGGQSLTLLGSLRLSGPDLQNWNSSIAPSLLYFTNNGTLTIPQGAAFVNAGPTNYLAFVNNGTISIGGGETIDSVYYQSSGTETAPAGYFVTTSTGKIENAGITSGQDMDFTANSLKLDNSTLSAGSRFNFSVTDPASGSLYDSGWGASNTLTCGKGFNLREKPAAGDLLGTEIISEAFNGASITNIWAGEDRGAATTAGYSNNVALGQLILSPQGSSRFPPLFNFSGAGASNALYVDMLDLSQISSNNLQASLNPGIVIYYAAAKLSFTPPLLNGVSQEPEEYLNGQFGGHLRWVSSFAGPNSSVDVIINGQTVQVNKALRYSKIIDSNGDGIPNYYDAYPFNAPAFVLTSALVQTNPPPAKSFAITWQAQPGVPYQVEYNTNLLGTNWLPLLNYTNTASTNRTVTVWDTNALPGQRFYRALYYTNQP